MAQNIIPTSGGEIIALGNQMYSGLNTLGETLGITQITPAQFGAALALFTSKEATYNASRGAKHTAAEAFTASDVALDEWELSARSVLAARLGNRWSAEWAAAGFINNSTAVPRRMGDRLGLVSRLVTYFGANPGYQVPALDVTQAKAAALFSDVVTKTTARNGANEASRAALAGREEAQSALVGLMRGVIKILDATLSRTDLRWMSFGLNVPADNTTPGQPQNLAVTVLPTHTLSATCGAVPLATRYRWRAKVVGVDAEFWLAASTKDPMAEITDVLPGQTVDVLVQAVNQSQGVASAIVRVVIPPVVQAAAVSKNGNGNGAHAVEELAAVRR